MCNCNCNDSNTIPKYTGQLIYDGPAFSCATLPEFNVNPCDGLNNVLNNMFNAICAIGATNNLQGLNLGGGAEVFKQRNGLNFEYRTLVGLGGTTVQENGDVIEISSSSTTGYESDNIVTGAYVVQTGGYSTITGMTYAIPTDGRRRFLWSLELNSSGDGVTYFQVWVNGAPIADSIRRFSPLTFNSPMLFYQADLNNGDTVELRAQRDAGITSQILKQSQLIEMI